MRFKKPTRVLIVAHQTADSRALIEAVAQRADAGPCSFTLLVPKLPRGLHRIVDPEDHGIAEAEQRLATAMPLSSASSVLTNRSRPSRMH